VISKALRAVILLENYTMFETYFYQQYKQPHTP